MYSFSERYVYDSVDSLKASLQYRVKDPINLYVEYMENQRFENEGYLASLAETLRRTYEGQRLDLVIPVNYPALNFLMQYRDRMFPGVPVVFSEVHSSRISPLQQWSGVTGVTVESNTRATIELALQLHPDTRNIAVVSGTSEFERYWLRAVHNELSRYGNRLNVTDLVGTPGPELIERVDSFPKHTLILFQMTPQESVHAALGVYDLAEAIGRRHPTYCIFSVVCVGHGGVGGAYPDKREQTDLLAEVAARVLSGERPEDVPVEHGSRTQVSVDWRQLHRWNIPESALPLGTVVLYREPTFWERDRNYIIAALVLIMAQSFLIAGLLWQRARKRKAEAILRESEERFRNLADTTPSLIWMCDEHGKVTYLNDKGLAFTGFHANGGYGDTWKAYLHPDDLRRVTELNALALKRRTSFSKEYRLLRNDGAYRWMFDVASPRVNGDGSFAGFIGSAIDITDQKLAQEALERVSGRLIEAQEKERTRIARDLHDDICQRLALLSMELEQANRDGAPTATKQRLEQIRLHCAEIAGDVQSLSHQLHSSKLDYLGIVAAVRGFCREFATQHKADIEFAEQNVPADLPKGVSLCLFRIVQEALHNAVKYSGTRQYRVALTGSAEEVRLSVEDRGSGFDVEQARRNGGLGLVSMQERANLVHGRFEIASRPEAGTTVTVTVPLAPRMPKYPVEPAVNDAAIVSGNS
jgi:PAS domain S-box-containing protein